MENKEKTKFISVKLKRETYDKIVKRRHTGQSVNGFIMELLDQAERKDVK